MSKFTQPLTLKPYLNWVKAGGGKVTRRHEAAWVLLNEDLVYEVGEIGSGTVIEIPEGFVTDLASVPRIVWWFIPPFGLHAQAAVLHDYLYSCPFRYDRKRIDKLFLEAMRVLGTPRIRAWIMYWAVRSPAGWLAWRSSRKKNIAKIVEI